MKKLWLRLIAEVPLFWKQVRIIAASIGIGALALLTANTQLDLALWPLLITICKYTIAVCVTITGSATMTKTDSNG